MQAHIKKTGYNNNKYNKLTNKVWDYTKSDTNNHLYKNKLVYSILLGRISRPISKLTGYLKNISLFNNKLIFIPILVPI